MKAVSDQSPMPVSLSGVMFEERTTPVAIGNSNPPAKSIPIIFWPFSCLVWHSLHAAAFNKYFPYSILLAVSGIGCGFAFAGMVLMIKFIGKSGTDCATLLSIGFSVLRY